MATNQFLDDYLPNLFWPAQQATFGTEVIYLPQGDLSQALPITGLWKDGATDEEITPGRMSRLEVQNADFPALPAARDTLQSDEGRTYMVVRVEALMTGYSTLVIEEVGPTL